MERLIPCLQTKHHIEKGRLIRVRRAPEPTDVIWANMSHTFWTKLKSRIFTTIVAFILIIISFGLIVLINWGQVHYYLFIVTLK